MELRILGRLGLVLLSVVAGLTACTPKLQGGGYATKNVLAGFGDWSGNGVGFGVYSPTGGVVGGTGVCLYQDIDGDGKLTCGELAGCAQKTSGAPEPYVLGGTTAAAGAIPPPGFICGTVAYRDSNGVESTACVSAQTDPKHLLDVCGLRDCCPCVKCPPPAAGDQTGGGHALREPIASTPTPPQTNDPSYEWRDNFGQLLMRVKYDPTGGNWTILAATALAATSIERLEVDAAGHLVSRQVLPTSSTSEGSVATWSGAPKTDQFTVFSARSGGQALVNFFVNATDRGSAKTDKYFQLVHAATFQ